MKKIHSIITLATGIFLYSCAETEFLEVSPQSSLEESVIFSSRDLTQGAVDGIKLSFGETNSYRGRWLPYYGMNTDIEWFNDSENSGDKADLAVYNARPNNGQMNTDNNAWAKMYEGIERANLCIQGIRDFGSPETEEEMAYLLGEAITLRAIFYADLLKTWGDVPAYFEPVTKETLNSPRTSRDVIYKQLIADLGEAATLVPWPNETSNTTSVERVNKTFVKAFRARLCLAASGFSQYQDGVRRSDDPELSVANMYAIARQECLDVIQSGTASLEPTFEGLWRKYMEEDVTAGGESLWEIPFAAGRGRMVFTFGVRHATNDQYHSNGSNRGGVAGPLPHIFYDYDLTDTRRDVTCVPYGYGDANPSTNLAQQELNELDTWYFGKYRYEWMTRFVTSSNDDGINKIYMRYAEVLLMMAEIENELSGPGAAAPYLKEIRRRAFDPAEWTTKVDAYVDALGGKDEMFNAIVEEHKFEFCGEMERKQALIRWNLLKTKIDEAKEKMYALRDRTGAYADVPETVYYRYEDDNETLDLFGLNRGETADPGGDYTATLFVGPEALEDEKIESIYLNDPNTQQYWPIWQVFLDASNGTLVNNL